MGVIANTNPLTYVKKDGDVSAKVGIDGETTACGAVVDFGKLDKLVGVITHVTEVDTTEKKVGEGKRADAGVKEEIGEVEHNEMVAEKKDRSVNEKVEMDGDAEKLLEKQSVKEGNCDQNELMGDAGREDVVEKTLDKGRGERPKERVSATEADDDSKDDEQALDVAEEEPFSLDKIVPEVEDSDFPFFERVLLANPKVLHLNAGNYDLDNQFFVDLATAEGYESGVNLRYAISEMLPYLVEKVCPPPAEGA
ncbi:hypothetical protein Bca52824_024740 [Brassica carinata]|uniref:Uncharacterized protein n=1 Tax=Brassica carinata TaxID=52824 RepID=A0A8X7VL93_BRACI|nr:hypothetical protein Bca52824_024740 [Brassica carinata]